VEGQKMIYPFDLQVLDFIASFQVQNGVSPTYREIASQLQETNFSTIARSIKRLLDAGLLKRDFHGSRTLYIPKDNQTEYQDKPYYLIFKGD